MRFVVHSHRVLSRRLQPAVAPARALVAACLVVALTGCTSTEESPFVTGSTCVADAPMLGFTLRDCAGQERSLTEMAGEKATLIAIGAGWCEPCRDEQPTLNALQNRYGACGLRTVGLLFETNTIAEPADPAFCNEWITTYASPFPTVIDPTFSVSETCRAGGAVPITLVLDATGVVVYKAQGLAPDTERVIQELTGCDGT